MSLGLTVVSIWTQLRTQQCWGGSLRCIRFLAGLFEPHSMESYRKEVGITAHAKGAQLPLVEEKKLERENIQ